MATHVQVPAKRRKHDPGVEERIKTGAPKPVPHGPSARLAWTDHGAADDDPSAIGTLCYGWGHAWAFVPVDRPVTFPMMFAVVLPFLELGQVAGQDCLR